MRNLQKKFVFHHFVMMLFFALQYWSLANHLSSGLAWGGLQVMLSVLWVVLFESLERLRTPLLICCSFVTCIFAFNAQPLFEDDYYRYFLDGHTALEGVNPYQVPPIENPVTLDLGIEESVGFPEVTTIYPPLTIQFFSLLARFSGPDLDLFLKLMTGVGLGLLLITLLLVAWKSNHLQRGMGGWVALMLCHPLLVVEWWQNHHFDFILSCTLLLTVVLRTSFLRGIFFATAFNIKYVALIIWPLLPNKKIVALCTVIITGGLFLPWFSEINELAKSLGQFAREWEMNSGFFRFVRNSVSPFVYTVESAVAITWCFAGVFFFGLWRVLSRMQLDMRIHIGMVLLLLVLVSPVCNPWYFTWSLLFFASSSSAMGKRLLWIFTAVPLHYAIYPRVEGSETFYLWWNIEHLWIWGWMTFVFFFKRSSKSPRVS